MARIWSDEGKLERWLEVELAALDAWTEVGVVPADAVEAIRSKAVAPTPERVAEIEERTHHDLAAFVDAVAAELGDEGRWFHYGLTSSDVVDTALALQMRDAGNLILAGVVRSMTATLARAQEHRYTLTMGRTHGVHAEPITFGAKLLTWVRELLRNYERLSHAIGDISCGKFSGAVGTYATTTPQVEEFACERLDLHPNRSSTQVLPRDDHAALLSALAGCASSLERFALEIRHLARTEVSEVREPFAEGQKGSSAMPHKRNPVVSERICGLARIVRSAAIVGFENVALWHERDISHSSAERVVIPDAFLALDYMLDRFAWLIEGLVVDADRMLRNVEASRSLFFSQGLLLALIEAGLPRDDAYRLVQRNALRAWDEDTDFTVLVRQDEDIRRHLNAEDLDAVFSMDRYTQYVDFLFEGMERIVSRNEEVFTHV